MKIKKILLMKQMNIQMKIQIMTMINMIIILIMEKILFNNYKKINHKYDSFI